MCRVQFQFGANVFRQMALVGRVFVCGVCSRRDVLRVQQLHGAVQFRQVGLEHQQQRVSGSLYQQVLHSAGRR